MGHLDLTIATEVINKEEHGVTDNGVDQYVYVRQRKLILRACSVEVAKVNVAANLSILLVYWKLGLALDGFDKTKI